MTTVPPKMSSGLQMPSGLRIEALTAASAEVLRRVRLLALRDAPQAFGSTYAREAAFSPQQWQERASRWDGAKAKGFVAWDGNLPQAIAGAYFLDDEPVTVQLVSMWVAPSLRGSGVADQLIDRLIAWTVSRGGTGMRLTVTSNNQGAMAFYRRLGFEKTGKTLPYRNDPALQEFEMFRSLTA